MSITLSDSQLKVNGQSVATIHSETELHALVKSMSEAMTRPSAIILVLSFLGTATTAEVAEILNMDRSNAFRYLSMLAEEGKVAIVDDDFRPGTRGRPTHIWKLA